MRGTLGLHPEHRQGETVLPDGARVLTCTKLVREDARTTMLMLPGQFRVDVTSQADSLGIALRVLSGRRHEGGPSGRRREARAADGTLLVVSEFVFVLDGLGEVRVTISLPSRDRGIEAPCTAMALIRPGSA